jgi:hypothetical protein
LKKIIMMVAMLLFLQNAYTDEPSKRFIEDETKYAPKAKKKAYSLTESVKKASRKYNIPELLIWIVIRFESSFDHRVVSTSKYKEKGLMQVTGVAKKGCDLTTQEGQIDCGTKWLRYCLDKCRGDILKGLTAYQTKKGRCSPSVYGSRKRFRRWKKYKVEQNGKDN